MLVYLVEHPNFDLMHSISCFSRIVFDEFITKRGRLCTKLVEHWLIGWLRKKHDNVYQRGELALRVLGEFCVCVFVFELFLALLCHFAWFAAFRAIYWLCSFSFF
jgi:hypothetical protein